MKTLSGAAHAQTARMDIHEVVRQLNSHLGPTLVAAMSEQRIQSFPIKWAKADGPTPSPIFQARILLAHRVWSEIAAAESDHIARAWFIGGNPFLGEDTPLTAVREDRGPEQPWLFGILG